ncbi:hypothetical protein ACO2Q8_17275 [Larkinella sp. VNQ87]|uniref:hypothetical protein n=1 Tax=Larkinella sp. VNQ87 TaxID=3400921 RepID=UPI003BFC7162
MKNFRYTLFLLSSLLLLGAVVNPVMAQFSVGINGSLASSDAEGSDTFYGGGINAKLFPTSKLALGLGVKAFGENYTYTVGGQSLEITNSIIPVTAMVEYYFTDGFLRPYLGAEAGVYATGYRVKFGSQESSKINSTHAGVAPKVGLVLALGNLGIFAEGGYNILFGNKDGSANVGSIGNVNFDRTSQFFTVNVGIQIGIPKSN